VVEAIGSDIDKERIRKEIIAEEVARKQMLELEIRRAYDGKRNSNVWRR